MGQSPTGPATSPAADSTDSATSGVDGLMRLRTLSGPAEDRARLAELRGGSRFPMLRSASIFAPHREIGELQPIAFTAIAPELRSRWNSDLPFTANDGSLWAGRGGNAQLMFGFRAVFGPAELIVAPQVAYQQNAEFQVIPLSRGIDDARHPLSSPWYGRRETIDLPSRFGTGSYGTLDPGQSSLRVRIGRATVGAATENLWWGPAIRNAVVLSSNAPGIPHLFIRSAEPLPTRFGAFEGQWILGRLQESRYFDNIAANNVRALSGIALTLRPAFDPDLALGFTRVVYRVRSPGIFPLGAAFDVFRSVGRPNSAAGDDFLREAGADQIFSLFARWAFPDAGFEAYGEWGRYEEPASIRDLLTAPHHSQGYTLGLQWVSAPEDRDAVRIQAEATYLEPSTSYRERRVISWYTSRPVPQGYTHHGQPIGAAIGPGASSQWAAADYLFGGRSQLGVFANRIRWDNAAFFAAGTHPFFGHDVSLMVGLRGGVSVRGFDVAAELSTGSRLNYLFQNFDSDWNDGRKIDVRNHSFRLTVSPRLER